MRSTTPWHAVTHVACRHWQNYRRQHVLETGIIIIIIIIIITPQITASQY